jgi:hypothetical protein
MAKPCLDCGAIANAARCKRCTSQRNIARHAARPQYQGDYKTRRAALRREAQRTDAPCWLCGQAIDYLADAQHPHSLHADHVSPGDPASPLMPSHKACNEKRATKSAMHKNTDAFRFF